MQQDLFPSSTESPDNITIQGDVVHIYIYNDDDGWGAFRVQDATGKEWSVVGHAPTLEINEHFEISGKLVWNAKFKREQIEADSITYDHPTTVDGIEKYLASGIIKGIGPILAKKLVDFGGADIFNIILNRPEELRAIPGIGRKKIDKVIEGCRQRQDLQRAITFLYSFGLNATQAALVFKKYGKRTVSIVRKDPYCLVRDFKGIGFSVADGVASKLNVVPFSTERQKQGILYALLNASQTSGHCALPKEKLAEEASKLLNLPARIFTAPQIERMVEAEELYEDQGLIFSPELYRREVFVSDKIYALMTAKVPSRFLCNVEKLIKWASDENNVELTEEQKNALRLILENKASILTGGPGVGKSYITALAIKIFERIGLKITICAPTGRAATRINELIDHSEAKTIHRTLGMIPGQGYTHNAENPLDTDVVILDETSMVDLSLLEALLDAIPETAVVIFVGDKNQLQSIGAGTVFKDLIESRIIPTAELTQIFRQALTSHIVTNAHAINRGEFPTLPRLDEEDDFYFMTTRNDKELQQRLVDIVTNRIPARTHLDPLKDIQVLVPMHKGPSGTVELNRCLQEKLNPSPAKSITYRKVRFGTGDRVLVCKNNYEIGTCNGEIGYVVDIDLKESCLQIDFDGKMIDYDKESLGDLTLGYAISVHKSQGSAFNCVVAAFPESAKIMLTRPLVYTGLTRAKKLFFGIGAYNSLAYAINNTFSQHRYTLLADRLRRKAA